MSFPEPRRQVEAMLLKTWSNDPNALSAIVRDIVQRFVREEGNEGLHLFDDSVVAITPAAGDPDVVEAACRLLRTIFLDTPASVVVRGLIFPAKLTLESGLLTSVDDVLLRDLDVQPPRIPNRSLQLTGHAVRELESRWLTRATLEYAGPSGRSRSVWTLTDSSRALSPWRNLEVLRRRTPTVMRSGLGEVRTLLEQPAGRVSGPLGCGKSRTVADHLATTGHPIIWSNAWTARSGGPSLAKDILQALLERPDILSSSEELARTHRAQLASWWHSEGDDELEQLSESVIRALGDLQTEVPLHLVVDDVHRARAADRELLERLVSHPDLGDRFCLHVLGREGGTWTQSLRDLPRLRVGPLASSETALLWQQLADGLSIPENLSQSFLDHANGHPWALEEGLLQLVRRRSLRQLYGNFFYSGDDDVEYAPTPRLSRHVEAEARRLGEPLGTLLLAAAGIPVPPQILASLAGSWNTEIGELPANLVASGLAVQEASTFGEALRFCCPAYALSLERSVERDFATQVRRQLAVTLSQTDGRETANWHRYELLAGTEEAVPVLLAAARSKGARRRSRQLFEALRIEIEHHRERSGRTDLELELLWCFLPLARRLGRLQNLDSAIDRGIELAAGDNRRVFAFRILKAEHALMAGNLSEAEGLLLSALREATGIDAPRQSVLISHLGKLLQRQDRFSEARKLYQNLLEHLDDDNWSLTGACYFHLGNLDLQELRLHEALDQHKEALDRRRKAAQPIPIGHSLSALGSLNLVIGNMQRAEALFRESIELFEGEGADHEIAFPLLGEARRNAMLGNRGHAVVLAREALERREGTDDRFGVGYARLALAEYQLSQGLYDSALAEARKAHFQLTLTGANRHLGNAERLLGRLQIAQRHLDLAREHFEQALGMHSSSGHRLETLLDRAYLIDWALDAGDLELLEEQCLHLLRHDIDQHLPDLLTVDLRLYRGLRRLAKQGIDRADPRGPLQRAYTELCRRTELLEPEQRNPYLMHVPDNRELVTEAAEWDLATVSLSDS